jgi:hypothetical protein
LRHLVAEDRDHDADKAGQRKKNRRCWKPSRCAGFCYRESEKGNPMLSVRPSPKRGTYIRQSKPSRHDCETRAGSRAARAGSRSSNARAACSA